MDGTSSTMDPMPDQAEPVPSQDATPIPPAPPPAEEVAGRDTEHPIPNADPDAPAEIHPHRVVEAILMTTDSPLSAAKIAAILDVGTARDVKKHVETLNQEYEAHGLSFRIQHLAGGYQILTLPAYNTWLTKTLQTRRETKLSPAAMETLAIVAYKQPCTRADVEAIRGVAAGDMLARLREMNLVKIVGRAEDLGRPMLYGTTKHFLETFGLPSLEDLPQVEAFKRSAPAESRTPAETSDASAAEEQPASGEPPPNNLSLVPEDGENGAQGAP
ncbi:MAG: SMC-Scp complex subunit ScpB [Phycisphaerae bacterium]